MKKKDDALDRFAEIRAGDVIELPPLGSRSAAAHVFEEADLGAVRVALAAGRTLLLRGEPGVGKSQLARAVAVTLERPLISRTIDARTESRDLLYDFDAVRRLAAAQVAGTGGGDLASLEERHFVRPGPLWWAYHWASAVKRSPEKAPVPKGWKPGDGVVVLLDEIDKADSSVPNGLLEALGDGCFDAVSERVTITGSAPFVLVTTNEERALPNAFLRRCMVHRMKPREPVETWFKERGRAHYSEGRIRDEVLEKTATLLAKDRKAALARGLTPPGQAEYLDLLRAVLELAPGDPGHQTKLVEDLRSYAFDKHPEAGHP